MDEACEAMWEAKGCAPMGIDGKEFDRAATRLRRRSVLLGQTSAPRARRPPEKRGASAIDLVKMLDPSWYLAKKPDVANAGVDTAVHYANWGKHEGRLPCEDSDLIRALGLVDAGTIIFTMADVVDAGLDPVAHFCAIGWRERRRPNLYFDTGWYIESHDVPADMNPLLHYLLIGEPAGLPPSRHFDPGWYRQR